MISKFRLSLIALFFCFGFGVVALRVFKLQAMPESRVQSLASRQLQTKVDLVARRGLISDRNGTEMAVSINSISIFANPRAIRDEALVANALGKVLGQDPQSIASKIKENREKKFIWIERQLNLAQMKRFESLDLESLTGIGTLPEYTRIYPLGESAAHVLGFVSIDGNGLEGLERSFDKDLSAQKQVVKISHDGKGRPLFSDTDQMRLGSLDGKALVLSLDTRLQYSAERALEESVKHHKAQGGSAVVMNPKTGEILALASNPAFDPNNPSEAPVSARRNRSITDPIEPGSVMKPFVVARALDDGLVKPNTVLKTGATIKIGRKTIHESEAKHEYQNISIVDLIKVSSNVGTVVLQQKIGFARLSDTLRKLSFGKALGIELGGESAGIFNEPRPKQLLEQATIAFGQGISVTPLQMATAYAALANGGLLLRPTLLKNSEHPTGVRVFSEKTSEQMRKILEQVVEGEGTGAAARIEGVRVAGKTGTAQKVVAGKRGYEAGAYWSSFAGFLPSDDPKYVIYVLIDEPKENGYYGAQVAAPVFSKIARSAVRLINERKPEQKSTLAKLSKVENLPKHAPQMATRDFSQLPAIEGLSLAQAMRVLERYPVKLEFEGDGTTVHSQLPSEGTPIVKDMTLYLRLR